MNEPEEILKKYWGYDTFRPLQKEIIHSVISGNDTLALMPTGGGKSLCFQVPSLLGDGICLVISPLIALIKDQVQSLKLKGIPALSIYSGMSFREVKITLENAAYGNFKFLYVSPERLETELFLEYVSIINVNLIAVDEAHCISQWGYDFRPPYLRIAALREHYPEVPILALTASATVNVQNDICNKLNFKDNFRAFQQSFERANLSYSVFNLSSKQNKLISILNKVPGCGIVYCKIRKRTKEIAELLSSNKISSDFYHAGLTNDDRNRKQDEWINNKIRVIVCTNAFGMGINKPDVRTVVHYDVPDALENYYQEAGRAGRDGKKSYAVLLYNQTEINDLQKQVNIRFPSKEMIRNVYGSLCNYLQLASGAGEGMSFDFDINTFVKNFKLEAFAVNYVLKILEQEELISYSQQFFSPSTVGFTISKKELELFEDAYPEYTDLIKGLLRSYEGIFDFPGPINETKLSGFISIPSTKVFNLLKELNGRGIISYIPQKEKPQILFLQNRVNSKDLIINEKNITKRKRAFEERLDAMIGFVENKTRCRSQMIGNYFNDKKLARCGICDNCISLKKTSISDKELQAISSQIKKSVSESPMNLTSLKNQLSAFKQTQILKVLDFLQSENIVTVSQEGFISLNGKKKGTQMKI